MVIGSTVRKGAALVHYVKDQRSGHYFQVGAREGFIMVRLTGQATLAQIGDEYAGVFQRRLNEERWGQILATLGRRGLLTGGPEETSAPPDVPGPPRSLLRGRLPLINPDRFMRTMLGFLGWTYSAWFVVPALLAVVILEAGIAVQIRTLWDEAVTVWRDPWMMLVVALFLWLSLGVHEMAHGLTCIRFGGTASEIGIMWRLPFLAPYCRVHDMMLFPKRRYRVYTAAAGAAVSLLLLLPVAPVWLTAEPGSGTRQLTAALLVFGSAAALVNLVPFFQFDGYSMLNHALGMDDLRGDSLRLLAARLRRGGRTPEYPRSVAVLYFAYGVASIIAALALGVLLIALSWYGLSLFTGGEAAAAIVAMGLAVGALLAFGARSR
ncbi:M50 family metallopeptidase [Sphaerimonospora sp. CA-214678]|uniref:M50 family metallopeptidase n=1 Tax=Sphaerimonospora sp. CA-214678 TaxID=3240029 RepID=UPI003D925030